MPGAQDHPRRIDERATPAAAGCTARRIGVQVGQILGAAEHRANASCMPERGAEAATTEMARMGDKASAGCSAAAGRLLGLLRDDADAPAVLAHPLVSNLARHECEQGVVATQPDAGAWGNPRPALADEDRACIDSLPGVDLHAQHLRVGVASIAGGAAAFLVCHLSTQSPVLWPASCGHRASASL